MSQFILSNVLDRAVRNAEQSAIKFRCQCITAADVLTALIDMQDLGPEVERQDNIHKILESLGVDPSSFKENLAQSLYTASRAEVIKVRHTEMLTDIFHAAQRYQKAGDPITVVHFMLGASGHVHGILPALIKSGLMHLILDLIQGRIA